MGLIRRFDTWLAKRNTQPAPLSQAQLKYSFPPGSGRFTIDIAVSAAPPTPGTDMLLQTKPASASTDISTTSATLTTTGLQVNITTLGTTAVVLVNFPIGTETALVKTLQAINRDAGTEKKYLSALIPGVVGAYPTYPSGFVVFTGLTPGAHTFLLEWGSPAGTTIYNNPATQPTLYARSIMVLDIT